MFSAVSAAPYGYEELNCSRSGVFAGAPEAARHLAKFSWAQLEQEPRREPRVTLGFPRRARDPELGRAMGCLLGQVVGDSLGSLVEFRSAKEIAASFPDGVSDLALKRAEYQRVLSTGSIEDLIRHLDEQTARLQ